jgi:uncharacterized damage-inducible protein DinB
VTVSDLQRLYDYGHWANRKLFPFLAQLTPDQFTQPLAGTHGSIRNTMVHVLSAEWGWLDRCGVIRKQAVTSAPLFRAARLCTKKPITKARKETRLFFRAFVLSCFRDEFLCKAGRRAMRDS